MRTVYVQYCELKPVGVLRTVYLFLGFGLLSLLTQASILSMHDAYNYM